MSGNISVAYMMTNFRMIMGIEVGNDFAGNNKSSICFETFEIAN